MSNNKKIAVNTIYMYSRLFITLAIGLYTSRIVLQVLGVSDYGLFAVVASVLTMFTFISNSLSVATSRFFNVEMGRSDGDVNRSYNINMVLHVIFAAIVFLLAETIGLWYIYNKLNITINADAHLDHIGLGGFAIATASSIAVRIVAGPSLTTSNPAKK